MITVDDTSVSLLRLCVCESEIGRNGNTTTNSEEIDIAENPGEDLERLLLYNISKAFNAAEKFQEGGKVEDTDFQINHRPSDARGGNGPESLVLDFSNEREEVKRILEDILEENFEEKDYKTLSENIAEIFVEKKDDTSNTSDAKTALFSCLFHVEEVDQKFVCMLITEVDDDTFSFDDGLNPERVTDSFDQDVSRRVLHPYMHDSGQNPSVDRDTVKIWEEGGEANFYVESFGLEQPESVKEKVVNDEDVDGDNLRKLDFNLKIGDIKLKFDYEQIQEGNISFEFDNGHIKATVEGDEDQSDLDSLKEILQDDGDV